MNPLEAKKAERKFKVNDFMVEPPRDPWLNPHLHGRIRIPDEKIKSMLPEHMHEYVGTSFEWYNENLKDQLLDFSRGDLDHKNALLELKEDEDKGESVHERLEWAFNERLPDLVLRNHHLGLTEKEVAELKKIKAFFESRRQ